MPAAAAAAATDRTDRLARLRAALGDLRGHVEFCLIESEADLQSAETARRGAAVARARADVAAHRAMAEVLDLAEEAIDGMAEADAAAGGGATTVAGVRPAAPRRAGTARGGAAAAVQARPDDPDADVPAAAGRAPAATGAA